MNRFRVGLLMLLAIALTGCGGGGGLRLPDLPDPSPVPIPLPFDGNQTFWVGTLSAFPYGEPPPIRAPLDVGATIVVKSSLNGGTTVSGTLNAEGSATIKVPMQYPLSLIIEGWRAGERYFMTYFILDMPKYQRDIVLIIPKARHQ